MSRKPHVSLPMGLSPYKHQVAGHKVSTVSTSAMLRHPVYPIIYKWLQDNARGFREVAFYELVFGDQANEAMQRLRAFIPNFYGVYRCPQTRHLFLGISDNLAAFKGPNICDVKLGTVGYRPEADKLKKLREDCKYTWRKDLGFLLCGMQVYDKVKRTHVQFSKQFCRSLTPEEVYSKALVPFLGSDTTRRALMAQAYLPRLLELLNWFEQHGSSSMTFCRTSLLLGHDAVGDSTDVIACLIDFTDWAMKPLSANRSNSPEADTCELTSGFARGLSMLITVMQFAVAAAAVKEPISENFTDSE